MSTMTGGISDTRKKEISTRDNYDLMNRLWEIQTSDARVSAFDLDKNSNLLTIAKTLNGIVYVTKHSYDDAIGY